MILPCGCRPFSPLGSCEIHGPLYPGTERCPNCGKATRQLFQVDGVTHCGCFHYGKPEDCIYHAETEPAPSGRREVAMSQARILCAACGLPQVYCKCEQPQPSGGEELGSEQKGRTEAEADCERLQARVEELEQEQCHPCQYAQCHGCIDSPDGTCACTGCVERRDAEARVEELERRNDVLVSLGNIALQTAEARAEALQRALDEATGKEARNKEKLDNWTRIANENAHELVEVQRVLGMVEWHGDVMQEDGTRWDVCPWCRQTQEDGHAEDCPRQLALRAVLHEGGES